MPNHNKKTRYEHFMCPITHSLMVNPVQASDGWTYERDAIAQWCEDHDTSPLDPSVYVDVGQLKTNRSLRDAIQRVVESGDLPEPVCDEWTAATNTIESASQLYRDGHFEDAAERGHPRAMGELANRYYMGSGVLQDIPLALKWATKAAIAGDAQGQFRLGYAFHLGEGKEKDWVQALKYYTLAYENGITAASSNISEMYLVGGFGLIKNTKKVVEWCKRSYTAESLHVLAACYYAGDGIPRDHALARRNFKASNGIIDSQYMLGKMMLRGEGGNVNFPEGIKWIDRAAKQGHSEAIALKDRILDISRTF